VISQRMTVLSSVALVSALALTACGSDNTKAASTTGAAAGGSTTAASGSCFDGTLKAEGSSAQKNAIDLVTKNYQTNCSGATINYNATGSGNGIKQFIAGQVDFAGSDSALKGASDGKTEAEDAAKTCGSPAWNLPMVTGPIAVAYNLAGVTGLTLTPDVMAKIFNGAITTWNDPAIAAINSGVTLPAKPIKVFFRSDESGTTENFAKYLKAAAPTSWTAEPAKKWTGKGEGKDKSAGVAQAVAATDGGLTYVEWSFATQNKLGIAKVDNGAGAVDLTADAVGKAVEAAKISGEGNDLKLKLDYATKAAGAYPIILVTYEIACSKYSNADTGKKVKSFLTFMAGADQQKAMQDKGYAPLPSSVQSKVAAAVAAIA
jgi:phosphate transport system substrate-binding protein